MMTNEEQSNLTWRTVRTGRFLSPGFSKVATSGFEGTVADDGVIETDSVSDTLKVIDTERLEAGDELYITIIDGTVKCTTVDEWEREQLRRRADKRAEHRKQRLEREEEREREQEQREKFWEGYEIPIEYDTGVNHRRSELLRGSSGTGRRGDTVVHLIVGESFSAGRLERDRGDFLCRNKGEMPKSYFEEIDAASHLEWRDSEEISPPEKVTCKTCLKRMKRSKKSDGEV